MKLDHLQVGDVDFAYVYHKGRKPLTIVQIHGHGGSHWYLTGIFDYPALTEYSILIPDQVGHGESSTPKGFNYDLKDQAKAIKSLMDALGIKENVVLLGSSLGGALAVMVAEMMHGGVKAIISAEGTLDPNDSSADSKRVLAEYTLEEFKAHGFRKRLEELSKMPGYEFVVASQEKAGPVADYLSRVSFVKAAEEDTLIKRLGKLGVPVLAIYGGNNKGHFTSESRMASLKRCEVVYIPNAGHAMMVQNPDDYYREVSEFINRL